MRKRALLTSLLSILLLLTSCGTGSANTENSGPKQAYQKISAEEGKALMDSGDVVVVDVRRLDEYEAGHIPGALLIPNEEIGDTQPELLPDLEEELILYCRSGRRSKEAADKLISMGYTNIKDMGGIQSWPYETTPGSP